jgi:hypothetical protein
MEVNTLVTHKKLKSLGIGCISKVLKSSFKVNFGTSDVSTCKENMLEEIDTTECKTISFNELRSLSISNSKDLPEYVIIGNELKHWVGIGWVSQGVVSLSDLKKYKRVI